MFGFLTDIPGGSKIKKIMRKCWVSNTKLYIFAKTTKKCVFHPVDPFGVLRISLGLAVRSFWSHLEKFPKSASGEIWRGWVNILAWGPFWAKKMVLKKMILWRNEFVVGF